MSLTDLPNELLDEIISCSMPQGFESLAMSCKSIYQLCIPFIESYNKSLSTYRPFKYSQPGPNVFYMKWVPVEAPIRWLRTAFDLIERIAVNPVIAYYVEEAELRGDSYPSRLRRPPPTVPDVELGGPVVALFASSTYLKEAGLDWKGYYACIKADVERGCYSQHAATFLLTLLPNLKTLLLPRLWTSLDVTDKLLHIIVRKARQSALLSKTSSLSQLTQIGTIKNMETSDLGCTTGFLALPRLRCFRFRSFWKMENSYLASSSDPHHALGGNLTKVHLLHCSLNDTAISSFLRYTPQLRSLFYSQGGWRFDWNACEFMAAIEKHVGSHLIELSIGNSKGVEGIAPFVRGRTSLRGFQRLQKLSLPIDLITGCIVYHGNILDDTTTWDKQDCFLSDLVPASVSRLELTFDPDQFHMKDLEVLFDNFAAHKESKMPALQQIMMSHNGNTTLRYKAKCAARVKDRLAAIKRETGRVGVDFLFLDPSASMEWEGEWKPIAFPKSGWKDY